MRHLVLDTNILHQESLMSANMRVLLRLVNSGFVAICLPSLVRREYTTKILHDCASRTQAAIGNMEQLLKVARVSRHQEKIESTARLIGDLRSELLASYEEDFARWADEFRVRELEFEPSSIVKVMDDYFLGASPFRNPKAREDLLDSMISTSISSLASEVGEVSVAVKDAAFRSHLSELEGVLVYESLGEFLSIRDVKAELIRLDHEEHVSEYLGILSGAEFRAGLARLVIETESVLDDVYLEDREVLGRENLGIECFGLRVNGPKSSDVKLLDLGPLFYVGGGYYASDFKMLALVGVDFCSSYAEYLELSDEREQCIRMESMSGQGICDLQEDRMAVIRGKVIIDARAVGLAELQERSRNKTNYFAGITIALEADSAELLPAE